MATVAKLKLGVDDTAQVKDLAVREEFNKGRVGRDDHHVMLLCGLQSKLTPILVHAQTNWHLSVMRITVAKSVKGYFETLGSFRSTACAFGEVDYRSRFKEETDHADGIASDRPRFAGRNERSLPPGKGRTLKYGSPLACPNRNWTCKGAIKAIAKDSGQLKDETLL